MAGSKRNARALQRMKRQEQVERQGGSRAVAYLRVSTEEQAEAGTGLEYQRGELERFAKQNGYELAAVIEDAGVSGATTPEERPGFAKILALAEDKAFDVLLVFKFDRLARSIHGAVTAAQALKEKGIGVRSATEPLDTTGPQGELVFALLTGMASMEREAIARRTWEGRRKVAEHGKLPSGPAPYGYRRENGDLSIIPEEAEVVRYIYKLRRKGLGAKAIAKQLDRENMPTRSGRPWSFATVAKILDQPLYHGTLDVLFGKGDLARGWTPGGQRVLVPADVPPILPVPKTAANL